MLFDGVCGLCVGSVRFLIRRDKHADLLFASLQSESGQNLAAKYGIDAADLDTLVLIDGTRTYIRSQAILRIAAGLGGWWRCAAAFLILPAFVREPAYRTIARYRYRWFGRSDECWLPSPNLEDRFL